jgi:hypothetical protein
MIMRLFWMDRLFRHAYAGDRVLTQAPAMLSAFPAKTVREGRVVRASAAKRLCLGIGDASVRRQ